MPGVGAIIWAAIAGLILIMLAVIGYFIRTGFEDIKGQLKSIWEEFAAQRKLAEENACQIAAMEARCEERHRRA